MKYIVCYTAKRKNARRHVVKEYGRPRYFNSVEEARRNCMFDNDNYNAEVLTANYKPVVEERI